MADSHSNSHESALGTILAVAGFLIVAAIAVWGFAHMLVVAKDSLIPLFSVKTETIRIMKPDETTSGEPFVLNWVHQPQVAGSYSFLYLCVPGVHFETANAEGEIVSVPCGAAFTASSSKSITLIPSLAGGKTASVPISVVFKPTIGAQAVGTLAQSLRAEGSASLVLKPSTVGVAKKPGTYTKPVAVSTKSENKPAKTRASQAGPADLSVRILSVGVIDRMSGIFVERPPYSPEEIVVVRFEIKNNGGSTSGRYHFRAVLPTETGYVYKSSSQSPLSPGSYMVNTLQFDRAIGGIISVTVLPYGSDARTGNNTASMAF
ncbi:hypothetical protein EBR66_01365 [bacterium]|nr:hypothetical protein [bacterium]